MIKIELNGWRLYIFKLDGSIELCFREIGYLTGFKLLVIRS
jgi:hypothetical protein